MAASSDSGVTSGAYWLARLFHWTWHTFHALIVSVGVLIFTGSWFLPVFRKHVSSRAAANEDGAIQVAPFPAVDVSPKGASLKSPSDMKDAHAPASSHRLMRDAAESCLSMTGEMKKPLAANQLHAVLSAMRAVLELFLPHVPAGELSIALVGNGTAPAPRPHPGLVRTWYMHWTGLQSGIPPPYASAVITSKTFCCICPLYPKSIGP